jgi:hypothetical protein
MPREQANARLTVRRAIFLHRNRNRLSNRESAGAGTVNHRRGKNPHGSNGRVTGLELRLLRPERIKR